MATKHRAQLSQLNIPPPNGHQQMAFDNRQPMFSPALTTPMQHTFHPAYSMNQPLHTPMQQFFPQGRPGHLMHKAHASMAHLGMVTNGMPMTPLEQSGFMSPAMLGPGQGFSQQQFQPRNRRAPSISLGGPPKAVLGGPNRKTSPLPPAAIEPTPATSKGKKINVNIPKETMTEEDGTLNRPTWARTVLNASLDSDTPEVPSPILSTAEIFPTDEWRHLVPIIIDVFLPGKVCYLLNHFDIGYTDERMIDTVRHCFPGRLGRN